MASDNGKNAFPKGKTGPKPETVTIKKQWEDAVETALQKKRPKDGWPKN